VSAPAPLSIVPARLPYLDRRALSEAWYAALRLARNPHLSAPAARRAPPGGERFAPQALAARAPVPAASRAQTPGAASTRRALPAAGLAAGTPAARARGIPSTRTHAAPRAVKPPAHARLTLTLDGARVRIIARRDGARTHVIALCSVEHVGIVRRALGVLEQSLRSRGERLEAAIRTIACDGREGQA
jgi:hypothetical protein